MKIAIAQLNPIIGDLKGNFKKIEKNYLKSIKNGAELVVMPELVLTGYPPKDLLERKDFINECQDYISRISKLTSSVPLIFGAPILKDKHLFNAAVVAKNKKIDFVQNKMLLPYYDVFDEKRYFTSGTEAEIYKFKKEKLGIMICEDSWNIPGYTEKANYKKDPVQILCSKDATMLINISASPFHIERPKIRRSIGTYHSAKNAIPFLLVNQIGGNDELIFDGNSYFISKFGEEIRCKSFEEDLKIIDTKKLKHNIFPVENELENLKNALVLGIKDYVLKCGFKKAVIGLSGGIDSALTAALAVQALGSKNVLGITMPSMYSSAGSIDDSKKLAKNLKIKIEKIKITNIYKTFISGLKDIFKNTKSGLAEENLQARIRGTLLMAISNKFGNLLLSTGNKSELSMGYCTLYGDMNGGLAVLGDLLKTKVYELANYLNINQEVIPSDTINKPPSAELRPNQKDSDSLPDYNTLDSILNLYLEEKLPIEDIISKGLDKELVINITKAVDRNEYKRRQTPPVLRISKKAFGTGRRMPIAAKL